MLRYVRAGLSSDEIALQLGTSGRSVTARLAALATKLARSRLRIASPSFQNLPTPSASPDRERTTSDWIR